RLLVRSSCRRRRSGNPSRLTPYSTRSFASGILELSRNRDSGETLQRFEEYSGIIRSLELFGRCSESSRAFEARGPARSPARAGAFVGRDQRELCCGGTSCGINSAGRALRNGLRGISASAGRQAGLPPTRRCDSARAFWVRRRALPHYAISDSAFAFGLGALGENFADCQGRFGEFI